MHRLLQGDVGSGKTVVAVAALLVAVEGGHQGAFMAPTEVLAEQHALSIRALLDGFTLPGREQPLRRAPAAVELLTSRTTAAERERIGTPARDGTADILIGTHALIEEGVRVQARSALVVVDEQHRFGVEQRAALASKGARRTSCPTCS